MSPILIRRPYFEMAITVNLIVCLMTPGHVVLFVKTHGRSFCLCKVSRSVISLRIKVALCAPMAMALFRVSVCDSSPMVSAVICMFVGFSAHRNGFSQSDAHKMGYAHFNTLCDH